MCTSLGMPVWNNQSLLVPCASDTSASPVTSVAPPTGPQNRLRRLSSAAIDGSHTPHRCWWRSGFRVSLFQYLHHLLFLTPACLMKTDFSSLAILYIPTGPASNV